MSFIDKVNITALAGNGGDGKRSFRRERFISKGGPDGGDGGDGGDVIVRSSHNLNSLSAFRYVKKLEAKNGQPGGKSRKHGKNGIDLVIDVPVGTEISSDYKVIADLATENKEIVIAKGGKGGFGNAHFTSSIRQAPNFAERGEQGETNNLTLELKLIADVGLVGLPNAGKSTLLSRLSNARPQIADYPFTTLSPNLGVVDVDKSLSILVADIPGLIEGAAEGKGLGHEFLRHIERTRVIVHLIDIYEDDIARSYEVIRNELRSYSKKLSKLPEVVVLNKIDGLNKSQIEEKLNALRLEVEESTKILTISAKAGTNLKALKFELSSAIKDIKPIQKAKVKPEIPRITLENNQEHFEVVKLDEGFQVIGQKVEKFANRTDFSNPEAVNRLKSILKSMGIMHELLRQGLRPGDQISFGQDKVNSFNF